MIEPLTSNERVCEFCGCRTNAAARACCDKGRDADTKPLNASDVIEALCALFEEIGERMGHNESSDCFCGKGGYWRSGSSYDGTYKHGYRFSRNRLAFVQEAVRTKLRSAHETTDGR